MHFDASTTRRQGFSFHHCLRTGTEKPAFLYKYRSLTERDYSNIRTSSLYFSPPRAFNDPFDCAIKLQSSVYAGEPPEDYVSGSEAEDLEHIRHFTTSIFANQIAQDIDAFLDRCGVCCFASRPDNLLMWSHYADSYRGACLEFSTDARLFDTVQAVIYQPHVPSIEQFNGGLRGALNADITPLFRMKSDVWAYEEEWRLRAWTPGLNTYEPSGLTAIYFGPCILEGQFLRLALDAYRANPAIRFFRARREVAHYKLSFEEVSSRFCR